MNGGDSYQGNTSVTVTATANEGYLFKKWTESGSEVSTDTSYTFTVSRDRALVAVFEKKEEEKPPTPPTPTSYIVSLGASPTASQAKVLIRAAHLLLLRRPPTATIVLPAGQKMELR